MALASYPGGIAEIEADSNWRDAATQLFRQKHGHSPTASDLGSLDPELRQEATERYLRLRHAERAEDLALVEFRHSARDMPYHLLEDEAIRDKYGRLIGKLGYSHWWAAQELASRLGPAIGAFPGSPAAWTIDPLKLALVLRAADACHLDARRAPGFLRALRKPAGVAENHWRFQEYVQTPYVNDRRLVFSVTKEIPLDDREAWWVGYELISLADRELRDVDEILRDTGRQPFEVDAIAGANDPARLRRYIPTAGWEPIPVALQVSDVAGLVQKLGGQGLYGPNPRVPLRELIQNARDAVVGRRIKERRDKSWGEITVRLTTSPSGEVVEVQDTGLGMSAELLSGAFLDFGTSYWNSALLLREHPGLMSSGFEPEGRFGIGFFSVFMWGDRIKVVTRRPEDSLEMTRVLEFAEGVAGRPILRFAEVHERLIDPGTRVQVRA